MKERKNKGRMVGRKKRIEEGRKEGRQEGRIKEKNRGKK